MEKASKEVSKVEAERVSEYVKKMKPQNYADAKSELDVTLNEARIPMSEALKYEILTN
jgi:hypothetical protein